VETPPEAAAPELLLDTETLEKKIAALAKADCDIRVCNRELLINGTDPAAIGSQREWEEITRLRGPRALEASDSDTPSSCAQLAEKSNFCCHPGRDGGTPKTLGSGMPDSRSKKCPAGLVGLDAAAARHHASIERPALAGSASPRSPALMLTPLATASTVSRPSVPPALAPARRHSRQHRAPRGGPPRRLASLDPALLAHRAGITGLATDLRQDGWRRSAPNPAECRHGIEDRPDTRR
jgi:hypothetical protein